MPLLLNAFQGVDCQLFSPTADKSKILTAREQEYACDLNDFSYGLCYIWSNKMQRLVLTLYN